MGVVVVGGTVVLTTELHSSSAFPEINAQRGLRKRLHSDNKDARRCLAVVSFSCLYCTGTIEGHGRETVYVWLTNRSWPLAHDLGV